MMDLKKKIVYQQTLDTLELKKDKGRDYVQREFIVLKLSHSILLF